MIPQKQNGERKKPEMIVGPQLRKVSACNALRVACCLKELRQRSLLTQENLAELAGVSRPTIQHLENGRSAPTLETTFALANAMRISLADLLKEIEQDPFGMRYPLE